MINGFVNVLKPSGMSSNYAVVYIRKLLPKGVKVGHMGTLDPAAAGVLPIGIGFGTRLFDYVINKEKEYLFELSLGVETDTQDADGTIVRKTKPDVLLNDLQAILHNYTGEIMQTPPAYSAVVMNGEKLYQIARRGGEVQAAKRPVTIKELEVMEQVSPERYLMRVVCGRGTYVRTLCHDMGAELGCGGHCSFLLRTRSGRFSLENSVPIDQIQKNHLPLLSTDFPLEKYASVYVGDSLTDKLRNGTPLSVRQLGSSAELCKDMIVKIYLGDLFVGLGTVRDEKVHILALMPHGEY